ncbi:MAG: MotA/TolQ/ExbB proton channel family protein, partial [Xanthomonadales bacterium]|nr:MotA/TolQ/ExbB proton channel family protein [Xanthomonadales bacterium]
MKPFMKLHASIAVLVLGAGTAVTALAQEQQQAPPPASSPAQAEAEPINPREAAEQLQAAYQKEYAFLEAQRRDLQARLAAFREESAQAVAAREAAIDRVESQWLALQSQAERMQDLINDAQLEAEAVDDARTTLEATFLQAGSTLETYEVGVIGDEAYLAAPDGEKIPMLFDAARALVADLGTLRSEPGSFFLADGSEVSGEIVRVGNVAAYGISEQGAGALAPAGEGRFKVWSEPAGDTARDLADGRVDGDGPIGIFLYESETRAIEEKAGKTVLGVISSGGTIAWIIVGLGLIALVLIVLRFMFLRRASASTARIVEEVGPKVHEGRLQDALEACKRFKGATSRVVASAVRNLDRDRDHLEDIVSESILHESSHLNRFGAIILVIAAVAPLLGLLGTVTGMITTFDIITEFGTGDPKLLSGGISIALVTTEIGLAVAIPALLAGNILSGWAERIKDDMEKGALRVINLYKARPGTA